MGQRRGRSIGSGLALLDLEEPRTVLRRTDEWILAPTASYERSGDVNKVVFPTGWVLDPTTQLLSMYYGAGDSVIALVTAKVRRCLGHDAHGAARLTQRGTRFRQLVLDDHHSVIVAVSHVCDYPISTQIKRQLHNVSRAGSSAAEQGTFNPRVVGSNPTRPSRF